MRSLDMTALLQKPVGNRQFHHPGTLSRRLLCDCTLSHIQTVGGDTRGCVHDMMLMACRKKGRSNRTALEIGAEVPDVAS